MSIAQTFSDSYDVFFDQMLLVLRSHCLSRIEKELKKLIKHTNLQRSAFSVIFFKFRNKINQKSPKRFLKF